MKVTLQRLDDAYHFQAKNEDGRTIEFDANPEIGGHNKAVRPMQSLLMAMGGCSAIDIVMILRKQRQEIYDFKMEIEGDRQQNVEPALWEKAHIINHIDGKIDADKAKRAVELSMTKYCSVSKTLEIAGASITWEVRLNGTVV